ncbi:MAG: ABC transporter permease [Lewinellaceae bacterium]|nr:ABC transporter permease [Lewinellaceae bacterium]
MAEDQGVVARLGTLTPSFVLGMLFPLFIIVLGFGSAAAERENGNLRLLLAHGVKPSSLFWGKSLGLWAAVLAFACRFSQPGRWGCSWQMPGRTLASVCPHDAALPRLFRLFHPPHAADFSMGGQAKCGAPRLAGVWVLVCLCCAKSSG